MKPIIITTMITLLATAIPARAQDEPPLPAPEFEQANFLLSADIQELNVDAALLWTDSLASLFAQPFDAIVLHVIDGEAKDVFVISDPPQNRVAFFVCSEPSEGVRRIERMGAYKGEDVGGLRSPSGLTTNAIGRLYDPDNDVIYLADKFNDRILELVYRTEDHGLIRCNRVFGEGYVDWPVDVAIGSFGESRWGENSRLFVVDRGHVEDGGHLVEMDFDNMLIGRWNQFQDEWGMILDLKQPTAIASFRDKSDSVAVYISEQCCNRVIRLSCLIDEEPLLTWIQGLEIGGPNYRPGGMAFDDYGRIYIANQMTGKIELFGPQFEWVVGTFGEPEQFFLPSNIIIDTYHGFCEALILEMYGRKSGMQTYIITNGVSEEKIEQGFYAYDMVKPEIRQGLNIPVIFSLGQAYPNPFNSKCKISFDLPQPEHVLIEVFNILGQRMLTLLDENRDAGTHTVVFDAADLSSGVYFYGIRAGSWTDTKSVVFLK